MEPFAQLLYYNQVNPALAGGKFRGVVFKEPEDIIEYAGRLDYGDGNARKLGEMSKWGTEMVPIIRKYLAMGHESMIEMGDATFYLESSRTVAIEMVRHRLCSYQQESQRFVKYDQEGAGDLFFVPPELECMSKVRYE